MKQTKRPFTPAELDRLFSRLPAVEEERRRRQKVGPREAELRRLREERAKDRERD